MTKISILLFAALGCAALAVSCSEEPQRPKLPPYNTLTGSIFMIGQNFVSEVTYDGEPMIFDERFCSIRACEVTDTTIEMTLDLIDTDKSIYISFHQLPLTGKPFDVAFDCTCSDVQVNLNKKHYYNVQTKIVGWIFCRDDMSYLTRLSPAMIDYAFEMEIECELDEKLLRLKIKDPYTE